MMRKILPIPNLPAMPADVLAGRIPFWDQKRAVHRSCPVCVDDQPAEICRRPDHFLVASCLSCGMIYLPEIPSDQELENFYKNYAEFKQMAPCTVPWIRKIVPLRMKPDPYINILKQSNGLKGKRICEIGCSFGSFLSSARDEGAEVFGVELDENALRILKLMGIPTSKAFDSTQQCDIVCAFQVIEHLSQPAQLIEQISSSLPVDGRLLIALPNGGEPEKVGPTWIGFRVDLEHLNYFSVASLSRLLDRFNLCVEHFWEYNQPRLPRKNDSTINGKRILQKAIHLFRRAPCVPSADEGTFVLCVLARKVNK